MTRQMAHFRYDPVKCQKIIKLFESPAPGFCDINGGLVVVHRKIDHTFTGPDLKQRLQIAEVKRKHLIIKYSTYDPEELIGYITAEANHTDGKKTGEKT